MVAVRGVLSTCVRRMSLASRRPAILRTRLLHPTKRQLILFILLAGAGLCLLLVTFVCWDGVDSHGNWIGGCEPIGGHLSWFIVPAVSYLAAAWLVGQPK